jgi:hypothetical protein
MRFLSPRRFRYLLLILPVAGVLASFILKTSSVQASPPGTWAAAASMNQSRDRFSGALLPSGKVLVAGSWVVSRSAELYDPSYNTWTLTGSMITGRSEFQAAPLSDGLVLVAGGDTGTFPTSKAELYNPGSATWSATGNLNQARENYGLAVLPNGKVLAAGGATSERFLGVTSSAEIYDPGTGTWTRTGSMNQARQGATATVLPNGKVLSGRRKSVHQCGCANQRGIVRPLTGSMNVRRSQYTATLLAANGLVLVAGGGDGYQFYTNSAELYNPATGVWALTVNMTSVREHQYAVLLPDGEVLEAGGAALNGGNTPSADLYQP